MRGHVLAPEDLPVGRPERHTHQELSKGQHKESLHRLAASCNGPAASISPRIMRQGCSAPRLVAGELFLERRYD
jgi:hypothetical protein